MSNRPPLLPLESLDRVVRLALRDGKILLFISGLFAIISALAKDYTGAWVGCLAAGAGAMELHGVNRLHQGAIQGIRWLVGSQVVLITIVLVYVTLRLTHFDEAGLAASINDQVRASLKEANLSEKDLLAFCRYGYYAVYVAVGTITLLYQGRLAYLYYERREAVEKALDSDHER